MRRLGFLAANTGFSCSELDTMDPGAVEFWVGCVKLHFAAQNEETE